MLTVFFFTLTSPTSLEGEKVREQDEVQGGAEGRTEKRKGGEAWSLATVDKNRKIETSSVAQVKISSITRPGPFVEREKLLFYSLTIL